MSAEHGGGKESSIGFLLGFVFCGFGNFIDSLGKMLGISGGSSHH